MIPSPPVGIELREETARTLIVPHKQEIGRLNFMTLGESVGLSVLPRYYCKIQMFELTKKEEPHHVALCSCFMSPNETLLSHKTTITGAWSTAHTFQFVWSSRQGTDAKFFMALSWHCPRQKKNAKQYSVSIMSSIPFNRDLTLLYEIQTHIRIGNGLFLFYLCLSLSLSLSIKA